MHHIHLHADYISVIMKNEAGYLFFCCVTVKWLIAHRYVPRWHFYEQQVRFQLLPVPVFQQEVKPMLGKPAAYVLLTFKITRSKRSTHIKKTKTNAKTFTNSHINLWMWHLKQNTLIQGRKLLNGTVEKKILNGSGKGLVSATPLFFNISSLADITWKASEVTPLTSSAAALKLEQTGCPAHQFMSLPLRSTRIYPFFSLYNS